ncbi:HamA C-terminal domain-containing protein [Pseudovibrio exalbescens]|uniref:Anti-bacteriophage protein A/HamA C-terminal domain-containing protein n=1 Tax=Pseudovibrio exalbescens TaxID=197461 RepID=A0A1U7JL82_9HYPH|nr:DUF1837 domain-containing protein [Pseudovibrio exalbescens]OKL45448.1 hypothetical protein A3843_03765 [Pseudovibrio exalbescens]
MNHQLHPQLKNAEDIKNVLKQVDVKLNLADGREVSTLLIYLPFESGTQNRLAFFEAVKNGLLSNFVFSCSEIERKLGVDRPGAAKALFNKAVRKLSKHTAQGELGELILFTILDVYLKAPKLLSKVSMKMDRRMPVFGADAVHGQFLDGKLRLYLGESKLHKSFKTAATKAATSIGTAQSAYEEEFDLLDSHIDFENIDDASKDDILRILNPFLDNNVQELIHSPCFIGFTESNLFSSKYSKKEFIREYIRISKTYINHYFKQIESNNISITNTTLIMLPFTCVKELTNEFIGYMGIEG